MSREPSPASLQAITDGRRRKTRGVFHAIEALFFDRGNQLTVANNRGRSIAVVGIDSKNVHGTKISLPQRGSVTP